jgi:acyl carrier protein
MKANEKEGSLRKILEKVVDRKLLPSKLNPEITLQGGLNIDSAMLVDIVLDMEERYSIHVPDDDLETLRTIGDLMRLIPSENAAGAPA